MTFWFHKKHYANDDFDVISICCVPGPRHVDVEANRHDNHVFRYDSPRPVVSSRSYLATMPAPKDLRERSFPIPVDVTLYLGAHETAGFVGLIFPSKYARCHHAVESDFRQCAEEIIPWHFALANV
jgi:hypothetical protein